MLAVLDRTSLDGTAFENEREVEEALKVIAQEHTEGMVEDWVRGRAHTTIREVIKLRDGTEGIEAAAKVARRVNESAYRIAELVKTDLSATQLETVATARRKALTDALDDSMEWKKVFRGRDILSTFAARYGKGLSYQSMRDMIVNAMAERGHRPPGMLRILAAIDNA